jgi:hypothetical protein
MAFKRNPGSWSAESSPITESVYRICQDAKPQIEQILARTLDVFEPVHYRSQVVAGTIYDVLIKTGTNRFIQVRLWRQLNSVIKVINLEDHVML